MQQRPSSIKSSRKPKQGSGRSSRVLFRWGIVLFSLLASISFGISFVDFSRFHNFKREVYRLEKRLHDRQNKLEAIALEALDSSEDLFPNFERIDEDFVVYKYDHDSLCFWSNTLPIAHDEVYTPGGSLMDFLLRGPNRVENFSQYPLFFVSENERYMNLGNAWYVVRTYNRSPYTVITALLIQTEYPFSNSFVRNSVNSHLGLGSHFSIIPVSLDEGYLVLSRDRGSVLFSVLIDVQQYNQQSSLLFQWLSVLLALLSLFCTLRGFSNPNSLWVVLPALGLLRLFCHFIESHIVDVPMVSPTLYADARFSESLLNLIVNNLFVFLGVLSVSLLRKSFSRFFFRLREIPLRSFRRLFLVCLLAVLPLFLMIYIHISFRSVIDNSSIVMEIFKISELSRYSILVYTSFGLLFAALYLLIFFGWPVLINGKSRSILLSQRVLAGYVVAISLYSLLIVSVFGARKEMERNKLWTQRMAMERDPDTEMFLRNLDVSIAVDLQLNSMMQFDMLEQSYELIRHRLTDYFFVPLISKYEIQITTCQPGEDLFVDFTPPAVNCYNFFHQMISSCGTQLFEDSHFFYLDNANGRSSYIGIFPFRSFNGYRDLYIELDSRSVKGMIGYPELLKDQSSGEVSRIPYNYSFAKYVRGELNAFSGNYVYPTQLLEKYPEGSFEVTLKDGYWHCINSFDPNRVIILSRPAHTFFLYVVSFSYLALFYGLILFPSMRFRIRLFWKITPNRSFRRKITFLVVISLIGALVFMGFGSVWFSVKLFNDNNRRTMDEKIATAQSMLEYSFRYLDGLDRVDMEQLSQQLIQLSENVHIDINIYDTKGLLVQTSQPEILEKNLMGRRMNSEAFAMMDRAQLLKYFHKEHIGNLYFYSIYAPLFNVKGKLIGYLNLPYFSKESDIANDITSIVATVANIYILLLLAAILGGTAISNQLGRPLIEVAKKMQRLDLTKQREHINYKGKDELGGLIHSYNKMVDDVAEASQRMAQTEREQAWREMARQIAHEIKNPLTPMRLSLQHLMRLKKEGVPDWPDRFDTLARTLIEQIDILSGAASELSSFSRFYSEEAAPVELNHLIREQCTLFSTGEAVKIYFISEVDPAMIMGRRQQLTRVLVNLISNARQALDGYVSGRIRLHLKRQEGFYALRIEDNGPGVPEKLRERLFTPNFTTKSGGTGLGLAICRSIIEQSQGTISYTSSEWGGACFVILLPVNLPESISSS